jgi:ATP-dependent RNA helicase RhlE
MTGHAISLVSLDEEEQLKSVNRLLKRDLPLRQVRGFELDPRAAVPARASRSGAGTGRARGTSGSRRPRAAAAR